jgi:hypothetical protein
MDEVALIKKLTIAIGKLLPWIDKELFSFSKTKNKYYNLALRLKTPESWKKFKLNN